jgi:hypothetical protein
MTTQELPLLRQDTRGAPETRDIARGWNVVLFWAGPVVWIVVASSLGQSIPLPFAEFGILLIVGTVWLGGMCLVNALRCSRAHCWVDGVLLPALAVVGGLNLSLVVHFPWTTYLVILWVIVIGSVVLECCVGSYPTIRAAREVRRPPPRLPPVEEGVTPP